MYTLCWNGKTMTRAATESRSSMWAPTAHQQSHWLVGMYVYMYRTVHMRLGLKGNVPNRDVGCRLRESAVMMQQDNAMHTLI